MAEHDDKQQSKAELERYIKDRVEQTYGNQIRTLQSEVTDLKRRLAAAGIP